MSNDYMQAVKNYGATYHWVPTYPQQANGNGTVLDLIAGTSAGSDNGGSGGPPGPVSTQGHYIRGSKYAGFGGYGANYMDGVDDYFDTGNFAFLNEMDTDFSIAIWIDYFDQEPKSTDGYIGARVTGESENPNLAILSYGATSTSVRWRVVVQDDAENKRDWNSVGAATTNAGPVMLSASVDWSEGTIVMYLNGVATTHNTSISSGSLGAVIGNDKTGYIGARNDNGSLSVVNKCGFGPLAWFGGTILSATQHATLYRLARAHDMSDSVHLLDEIL